MKPRTRRLYMVAGGMACLGVAVTLVLIAFSDNIVFFYSPSDLAVRPPSPGRPLRLGGLVEDQSVTHGASSLDLAFKVTDGAHDVRVTYHGVPPSLFREGQGVVAEGHLAAGGVFVADTILAKHDERYMPKEVVEALKKSGQWRGDGPGEAAAASLTPAPLTQ